MPFMRASELVSECILRRHTGKAFVMVEGVTDRALWVEYADCAIIPTQGKDLILEALNSPMLRKAAGIAGIVDADYWLLAEADERELTNLLYDDCCPDMEMILLSSPALRKVMRHSLDKFDIEEAHNFADKLNQESQRLAAEIGYFRLLNEAENIGLNFKSLDIAESVDRGKLQLDDGWLARRLAGNRSGISRDDLLRGVADLRKKHPPDNIQLCRGKDVIAIMARIAPELYESHFGEQLPDSAKAIFQEARLAKELRKAYEYIHFADTSLFQRICHWEEQNIPYRIIRDFSAERTPA